MSAERDACVDVFAESGAESGPETEAETEMVAVAVVETETGPKHADFYQGEDNQVLTTTARAARSKTYSRRALTLGK